MASVDLSNVQPTFDQLCELCTAIFDGTFDWEAQSTKPHRDINSLSDVAKSGCHMCSLILASIHPADVSHLQHDLDNCLVEPLDQLTLELNIPFRYLRIHVRSPSRPPTHHFYRSDLKRNAWCAASLTILRNTEDYTQRDRVLSSSNYSAATVAQITRWLGDCIATHSECFSMQVASATRDILPTRLLDLADVARSDQLRLVATKGLPEDTIYATLSHCWGGKCALTLTVDNLSMMEAGIATNCLPKTFRDAVSVTMDLSIRYLWIDALCIIQDSANDHDWSHEAAIMGDVYANSYITIAATTSPNSTGGLFHQRNPLAVWPCRVTARWSCFDPGHYVVGISELVRDQNQAPLIERAWAYQEWLLSKRLLHFSDDQVRWQCYCLSASEVYPRGLDEDDADYQGAETKAIISDLSNDQANRHSLWQRIREEYSEKSLTKSTDKLAAFSGIARMAHKVLDSPPADYLAGLWKPELLRELLWTRYEAEIQPRNKNFYIAPTWSWASLNGPVWIRNSLWSNSQFIPVATVLDIKLEPIDDAFGPVKSGKLTLQCSLSSVTLITKSGSFPRESWGPDYNWTISSIRGASTATGCALDMDYRSYTPVLPSAQLSFYYAPIIYRVGTEHRPCSVTGLLLLEDSVSSKEYVRVGVLEVNLGDERDKVLGFLNLQVGPEGQAMTHGLDVVEII
ncbi:HET domain containing protein [Naviculisporaceae sp. PSN 640]